MAPRPCGGRCWALLGELDKVASVSGVRFVSVEAGASGLSVRGVGMAGEVLSLGAVAPGDALEIAPARVVVDSSGTFSHTWS